MFFQRRIMGLSMSAATLCFLTASAQATSPPCDEWATEGKVRAYVAGEEEGTAVESEFTFEGARLDLPYQESGASCLSVSAISKLCGGYDLTLQNDCSVVATLSCNGEEPQFVVPEESETSGLPDEREEGPFHYECVVTVEGQDILLEIDGEETFVRSGSEQSVVDEPEDDDAACSVGAISSPLSSPLIYILALAGLVGFRRRLRR